MRMRILVKPRNRQLDDPMACHNVLESVSAASLNGILGATSPEDSSQFVKTMTGFMLHACSPAMRTKILDVITRKRLDEISITNRAVIIRAIQRCLLSPLQTEKAVLHTAACNVIRGTFGKDLTLLKDQIHFNDELFSDELSADAAAALLALEKPLISELDIIATTPAIEKLPPLLAADEEPPHSGDLSHLIFRNKNLTEVVQVMQHIAVESLKVKADEPHLVKVVSDIDDTLFPGWLDRRYPLHIPYPGVSDLFARISRGLVHQEVKATDRIPPSITFLTARPRGWLSMGRYMTVQHLKSLGVPNATVLNGSVKGLVSSKKIARYSQRMVWLILYDCGGINFNCYLYVYSLKMENFTRFASLYPEFKFVFFGDSGQGDALLASKLLQAFPEQVLGTFIHDVNPLSLKTGDGQEKAIYRSYVAVGLKSSFDISFLTFLTLCFACIERVSSSSRRTRAQRSPPSRRSSSRSRTCWRSSRRPRANWAVSSSAARTPSRSSASAGANSRATRSKCAASWTRRRRDRVIIGCDTVERSTYRYRDECTIFLFK